MEERPALTETDLLRWAEALSGIARTGLGFTESLYERERFEEVLAVAADIRHHAGVDIDREELVREWLKGVGSGVPGYVTPKVAVGAVVGNDNGEILLIQRSDSGIWLYPTGWADIGYSPSEVVLKEVHEETGIHCEVVSLLGVLDGMRLGFTRVPLYSLIFYCRALGGELTPHPLETQDVGWFSRDNLPSPLAGYEQWGDMAFAAINGQPAPVWFDEPRAIPHGGADARFDERAKPMLGNVCAVSALRWHHRPKLRRPVLVAAFEGWNDAGDAASGAARWLADRYGAELVATIDSEDFFDFTTTRPIVELTDEGKRRITWPDTELWAASTDSPADLVIMVGHEPHLRWKSYCKAVTEAADALECSMVLTLGALLSDVPHTRPTSVSGTADDPELMEQLQLVRSTYEGPTGIVGVLHAACNARELPSASLWAAVPTYVSGAPSPKATLALVERACSLLGLDQPTTDLQIATAAYERQIDELVEADEDTAAYVAGLEEAADDDDDIEVLPEPGFPDGHPANGGDLTPLTDDPDALVEEVERFLRGD